MKLLSCDIPGENNIKLSDGYLSLKVKSEKYVDKEFTGATISSKVCFKSCRVEIRAKGAVGKFLRSTIFMMSHANGCNTGQRKGQVDIAKLNHFDKGSVNFDLYYGERDIETVLHLRQANIYSLNIRDFHVYGIEWNSSSLTIFFNDRILYQSNHYIDEYGNRLRESSQRLYLPFDNPFNLMLTIGVG